MHRQLVVHCAQVQKAHTCHARLSIACLLKVRDLHLRDSENVTTYGGQNLQKLAAALSEEERAHNSEPCI